MESGLLSENLYRNMEVNFTEEIWRVDKIIEEFMKKKEIKDFTT